MPTLITEQNIGTTRLCIISYDRNAGEEIHLSYTHGRENGPGIERTGIGSPFMQELSDAANREPGLTTTLPDGQRLRTWVIADSLIEVDRANAASRLAGLGDTTDNKAKETLSAYIGDFPRNTAHDLQFVRAHELAQTSYEIIGMQGCGDLTMNLWNVAFINSPLAKAGEPRLLHLYQEPISSRVYTCLVKWKTEDGLRIEHLRFDPHASDLKNRVWAPRLKDGPGGEADAAWCGDRIEFAVSNQQIIRDGEIVNVGGITHKFGDMRHLLKLPNLNPAGTTSAVPGERPRVYFGKLTLDDVWFGEAQLIDDVNLQRLAVAAPVFLSRLHKGLGAMPEQVKGAMKDRGYVEVTDQSAELKRGEFRLDGDHVEVFLMRNIYAWTMLGLNNTNDQILSLACSANHAEQEGYTLEEAAEKLRVAGAYNALLIDEGIDVFQFAKLDRGSQKITVVGAAVPLDVLLPCPFRMERPRLRAVFIFARKKA